MRDYILRNISAIYYTDANGVTVQCNLLDSDGISLLSGQPVEPPTLGPAIADRVYVVGSAPVTIDLSQRFIGASGYGMSPTNIPGVTRSGAIVTIDPATTRATTAITVSGTNTAGTATMTFNLTVNAVSPTLTAVLPDRSLTVGDAAVTLALGDYFANAASYSVSPTGQGVSISGSTMTISAAAERNGTYTVTASNSTGQTVSDAFALVVTAALTAPVAFAVGDWTLGTGTGPSELIVNVSALPANGGSAITAIQYSVDGGTWTALTGAGTGARTLTMAAPATSYAIRLRAVNTIGNSTPGDTKTAISGAVLGENIGGSFIGQVGTAGTIYEGLRLIEGDDFATAPTRWNGRNLSGRYGHSAMHVGFRRTRGGDTAMYIDPAFRGARSQSPVDLGYDGASVAGSVLSLTASAPPSELLPMLPTIWTGAGADGQGRPRLISGGLKTGPSFMLSAGADFAIECRVRLEAGTIRGYWPSFWTSTFFWPDMAEIDVLEGKKNASGTDPMTTLMNYIANASDGGGVIWSTEAEPTIPAGRWVLLGARRTGDTLTFYDDIAVEGTIANRITVSNAARIQRMRGAHDIRIDLAVASDWDNTTFNAVDWPAAVEFDWWRAWVPATAARANEPLQVLPPVLTTPGGSWAATFPTAASLYGGAAGLEQVTGAFDNFDAPGMPTRNSTTKLPTSMTVNLAARTVAGTVPATEGGAMGVFITYAYADGSPAKRTLLPYYVAPAVQDLPASWSFAAGVAVNITIPFTAFHSGNLGPHTYAVTAPGLTVTGNGSQSVQITGTAAETATVTIAATNIEGQTTTVTRTLTVSGTVPEPGPTPAYASWTGPAWFDFTDASTLTLTGTQVDAVANKRAGGGSLTGQGTPANITRVSNAVRLTRLVSAGGMTMPRLEAPVSSPISQLFQGDDKPFTIFAVYTPLDTNTGYVWSASGGVDALNGQGVAAIRRTTANSIRRKQVTGANNDVNFGTGQPANTRRVLAVRFTGTTVTIWDNSLTKTVADAPQNTAAMGTTLAFMLGALRDNAGSYAGTQSSTDYFEVVVDDVVHSDAVDVQAITDLATKHSITLS